ncbi:type IV pilus modification protein PilV [Polaromonas sp. OV174]|uniref:type IV pilus modification PilV family protein n=1 Tax=Polaromonas sp. OV174 TaxID=1855300 RepID=UPI0008F34A0D|nr:prepilin-type N-terminal cleavage/methylation domain-containing protein [Polaromonas sp. OV174]SFC10950.1 type IV pilus modification protein PilV [Polaromonas sp. OV174]
MNTMNAGRRGQLGFTIIEALIALVIMGFGILSLAGMQAALSRNADDAKQRTEAVRLAQEKIESFRSYSGIASTVVGQATTSTTALNWNALAASGTDPSITTNAVYGRTWTMNGSSADPMRGLTVNVAWTNRAGEPQTVSLSSVLSKTDPADSGFLGFPLPLNTNLKRPKNRNLDIPIPAIDLGNGKSAVKFGTTGQYVVFGNISGDVVKICTPTLNGATANIDIIAALTDSGTSNCTDITGFIVAGYVGRDSSISYVDWNAIESGLGIDFSGITRNAAGPTGVTCQFGNATNQNTGATIPDSKYYLCVVPLAAPSPAPSTNGPYNWSGAIRIAGPSAWHTSANKYYVCRYQYATTNSLTDVNQRNVQPYVAVNKSIDQQNYLIAVTANATSAPSPTCPSSMTVANVSSGVLHQDCRSASNPNYATACP